jgi:hypothetical protein
MAKKKAVRKQAVKVGEVVVSKKAATQKIAATVTKAQAAVFQKMPKPLREVAARVRALAESLHQQDILQRYEIGTLVKGVTSNEQKYGERAVEMLAEYLGVQVAVLQVCRRFAKAYSKADVSRALLRVGQGGQRITFSHFGVLASVEGPTALAQRQELEDRILSEGLSVRELSQETKLLLGGPRGNSPGRKVAVPKSVQSGLADMTRSTQKLLNRVDAWEASVLGPLAAEGAEFSEALSEKLIDTEDFLRSAVTRLNGVCFELAQRQTALEHAAGVAEYNAEHGPEEPEPAAEAETDAGEEAIDVEIDLEAEEEAAPGYDELSE